VLLESNVEAITQKRLADDPILIVFKAISYTLPLLSIVWDYG